MGAFLAIPTKKMEIQFLFIIFSHCFYNFYDHFDINSEDNIALEKEYPMNSSAAEEKAEEKAIRMMD